MRRKKRANVTFSVLVHSVSVLLRTYDPLYLQQLAKILDDKAFSLENG
jgi:hypothetical protein